jgi:hypothetical protein
MKFGATNTDDTEQKQRLIDTFVNCVYVYDDKMLISFNYKDGEKCLPFDEVGEIFANSKNPAQYRVEQGSPLSWCATP